MAYLLGFNNNIRCIEMLYLNSFYQGNSKFNNNIRCIEMKLLKHDLQ